MSHAFQVRPSRANQACEKSRLPLEALAWPTVEPMENRTLNGPPLLEVLDDNLLEQCRRHVEIPNALGIDDDNGSIAAHTEAGRLAALYAIRSEQKILALQQFREKRINLSPSTIGRAETPCADQDMPRVRLHLRRR